MRWLSACRCKACMEGCITIVYNYAYWLLCLGLFSAACTVQQQRSVACRKHAVICRTVLRTRLQCTYIVSIRVTFRFLQLGKPSVYHTARRQRLQFHDVIKFRPVILGYSYSEKALWYMTSFWLPGNALFVVCLDINLTMDTHEMRSVIKYYI